MNQDNQVKIMCPRCGNEFDVNARNCLNCGWINPNVSANHGMRKFIKRKKEDNYQVGLGQTVLDNNNQIVNSVGNRTGSRKVCFLINYLLYILIIVFSCIHILGNKTVDLDTIKNSLFPYVAFITSTIFLYVYSMELIFMKANKRWWYALIPFYNLIILGEIVYKKKWVGIILLIPIIGQLFFIVTLYKLAGKFKYNGLLTIILPIIYIPLMGFGSRLYENINYVSEDRTLEKDYRRKKVFFISLLVFFILSVICIFWNNIVDVKSNAVRLKNYYYVFVTRQVINKTKQIINENYLVCDKYSYSATSGKYYIEFPDVGSVTYVPFRYYNDIVSAYVIVDNTSGSSKYYISISDGTYGYPETLYDDVNIDSIVSYSEIKEINNINKCVDTKPKVSLSY